MIDWLGGMEALALEPMAYLSLRNQCNKSVKFADWLFGNLDTDWAGFMEKAELAGKIAFEMLMLPITAIAEFRQNDWWRV